MEIFHSLQLTKSTLRSVNSQGRGIFTNPGKIPGYPQQIHLNPKNVQTVSPKVF
uniref:Uncharacterized protein n=1 Tax=Rhizophora mucronata TaxID=61149 RepID=A0A2P2MAM6_RHIMU